MTGLKYIPFVWTSFNLSHGIYSNDQLPAFLETYEETEDIYPLVEWDEPNPNHISFRKDFVFRGIPCVAFRAKHKHDDVLLVQRAKHYFHVICSMVKEAYAL